MNQEYKIYTGQSKTKIKAQFKDWKRPIHTSHELAFVPNWAHENVVSNEWRFPLLHRFAPNNVKWPITILRYVSSLMIFSRYFVHSIRDAVQFASGGNGPSGFQCALWSMNISTTCSIIFMGLSHLSRIDDLFTVVSHFEWPVQNCTKC